MQEVSSFVVGSKISCDAHDLFSSCCLVDGEVLLDLAFMLLTKDGMYVVTSCNSFVGFFL